MRHPFEPSFSFKIPFANEVMVEKSLYESLVKLDKVEQIDNMAQEFSDRFGALPPEVENLLYTVKIKILAARAGIESISSEHGQIIIRLFEGLQFDRQQLKPILRDGIKLGFSQLRLNPKRLGGEWQKVLEEVLRRI